MLTFYRVLLSVATVARQEPSHRHSPLTRPTLLTVAALALLLSACKGNNDGPAGPVVIPTTSRSTVVPTSSAGFVEARTSQAVTNGGAPASVFDDFSLTGAATIRTLAWQGIYCVQQPNAAAPAPTASSFRVTFHADNAGRPNTAAPLQTSTYTLAQVGQTFDKNVSGLTCGTAANTTWPFYRYSVTLATPFVVTPNTKYWISIQAVTPSYDVYWGWRDGTADNNLSLQLFQGVYTTYPVDRAYSLAP